MSVTYGEQMLARAEAEHGARAARKRRRGLMYPTAIAILWSMADLIGARHARLAELDAGFFVYVVDHSMPIIWTVAFVLLPMVAALKADPLPAGAPLAFIAGPILTPFLFGPGGFRWWQLLIVTGATALVTSATIARARGVPAAR